MNLKIEFAIWSTEEHLIAQQVKEDDFFIGITYRTLNLFTYELVILLSWSVSLIIIFCLCLSVLLSNPSLRPREGWEDCKLKGDLSSLKKIE